MPMPIQDALFLYAESRQTPMHVAGLMLLEPPEDSGPMWLAEQYAEMLLHHEVDDVLSRRPVQGLTGFNWTTDRDVDLEYHVRHSALAQPGRVRELLNLTGRLHGTLLDRSRPLWESHLIEGLSDGRVAMYTKFHHALVDGVSASRRTARYMADEPDPSLPDRAYWSPEPERDRPRRDDRGGGLVGALTQGVGAGIEAVRNVRGAAEATIRTVARALREEAQALPFQAPTSILNVPVTGARRYAADDWPLERLALVRKATGGSLNDVVMAMVGGAMRSYLEDLGALPDSPLVAMVPVNLRNPDDTSYGNSVGVVLCNLGTHVADPEARFDLISSSMQQGKLSLEGLSPTAALLVSSLNIAGLGLGPLYRFEPVRRPPFNLVVSNVPGRLDEQYWRGARVTGDYPLSIPTHGQAMNVTVKTSAGQLNVGITGDRRALPSLQRLLVHLEDALSELEHAVGL